MEGKRPLRARRRSALLRLAMLTMLVLSPLGAPAPGFLIAWGCDIGFFDTYPRPCVLPEMLVDYFAGMLFVALTAGSFVIAVLWLLLAGGLLLAWLACVVKLAWLYGVERLADEPEARPGPDGEVL